MYAYFSYLETMGATLPPEAEFFKKGPSPKPEAPPKEEEPVEEDIVEESDPESEVELDMTGVIDPDKEEPQIMGDPAKEVSEGGMI